MKTNFYLKYYKNGLLKQVKFFKNYPCPNCGSKELRIGYVLTYIQEVHNFHIICCSCNYNIENYYTSIENECILDWVKLHEN